MYDQEDEYYSSCTNKHARDFGYIGTRERNELSKWTAKMLEERRDKLRALHGKPIQKGPYPYNHKDLGWVQLFFIEKGAKLVYKWDKKEGILSLDVRYGPMAEKPRHPGLFEVSLHVEHFNPKTGKMHDRLRPKRNQFVRMTVLYDILNNEASNWIDYEAHVRKQIEVCKKQVQAHDKNEKMANASAPAAKEKGTKAQRKSRRRTDVDASENIDGPNEQEAAEAAAKGRKFSCQKTLFAEDADGPKRKVTLYTDDLWREKENRLRDKLKFWLRTESKFASKTWRLDQEHNPDSLADLVINNLALKHARLMAKELFDLIKETALKGWFIRRYKTYAEERATFKRQQTMMELQLVEAEIEQVLQARKEIEQAKKRAGPKKDNKTKRPSKKRKSSGGPTRKSHKAKKPTRKGPATRKSPRKKIKGPTRTSPRKKASGPKSQVTVDLVSDDDDFEAEAAPSSAVASAVVTPPADDAGFVHKPHYVRSAQASSGYKGVIRCNRPGKPWRVKYKGDTVARLATKAAACEYYYQMVRSHGPSSSRTNPDVVELIERYDVHETGKEFKL